MKQQRPIGLILALAVLLLFTCAALVFLLQMPEPMPPVMATVPTEPAAETSAPTETENLPEPTEPPSYAVQAITAFAQANNLTLADYPESLIELLDRNPETEEFVLNYPLEYNVEHEIDMSEYEDCDTVPLFIQWDRRWGYIDYGGNLAGLSACGPVCLSMAAYYLTDGDPDMAPDKIIQFALDHGYRVPGNGSAWTLISEGGKLLGLDVIEITADEDRVLANLEVGNVIICVVGPGVFTTIGHFIVLAGTEDGLIKVNDPNSYANSEKLWDFDEFKDQINAIWVLR